MLNNSIQSKSLEKRLLIIKLIQEALEKNPASDHVIFSISELNKHPILRDLDGLKMALEKIQRELNNDFKYQIATNSVPSGAADYEGKNNIKIIFDLKLT